MFSEEAQQQAEDAEFEAACMAVGLVMREALAGKSIDFIIGVLATMSAEICHVMSLGNGMNALLAAVDVHAETVCAIRSFCDGELNAEAPPQPDGDAPPPGYRPH